jgi:hypothetical protein
MDGWISRRLSFLQYIWHSRVDPMIGTRIF